VTAPPQAPIKQEPSLIKEKTKEGEADDYLGLGDNSVAMDQSIAGKSKNDTTDYLDLGGDSDPETIPV
jgi:hypothetical protein